MVQSYYWYSLATTESTGEFNRKYSASRDNAAKKLNSDKLMEAQRITREWEKSHPAK
jgi:hypothetical protein